jgi:glycosyltransferase involved in cell wall biosynthesis
MLLNRYLPVIGGAEIQAAQLCGELKRRGHYIQIITRRLTHNLLPVEIIDGLPVRRLSPVGLSHLANAVIVGRLIWHLLRHRNEFDIIHVHTIGPLGLAAIIAGQITRKPVILKVPGYGGLKRQDAVGIQPSRYSRFMRRFVLPPVLWRVILRRAAAIIAISREIFDEGCDIGLEGSMVNIPNGVDAARFHPLSQEEKAHLRKELNLPRDRRLLIFCGRLVTGKRVDVLLSALPSVLQQHPDCHVLLAGSGRLQHDDDEVNLRQMVDDLIADASNFWAMCRANTICALLTFSWPSERKDAERRSAMATGLPIVANRGDDLVDEESAWLVQPGDSDALSEAIIAVLDDEAEAARRGKSALDTVLRRFSLHAVATSYEDLYTRLRR